MRLLIFTPTWIDADLGVEAMHPKCRAAIEAQQIDADVTWVIGQDNPYPVPDHRNVLKQYQNARALMFEGHYDALLTVEHDNVLPDALAVQRMLDTPADVVYAPYLLRHGTPLISTFQYINDRNIGMSLTNYPHELRSAREAIIWRVSGVGMGCTLFRRDVLAVLDFQASNDHNLCPDMGFAERALRAGIQSYGRFDVPVVHYSRGRWLYPFERIDMEYIARENRQAYTGLRIVHLEAGKSVDLDQAEAQALLKLGLIEDATPVVVDSEEELPTPPPVNVRDYGNQNHDAARLGTGHAGRSEGPVPRGHHRR